MNRNYRFIACITTILLCISVFGLSLHAAFQDTVNLLQASKKGDLKSVKLSMKNSKKYFKNWQYHSVTDKNIKTKNKNGMRQPVKEEKFILTVLNTCPMIKYYDHMGQI